MQILIVIILIAILLYLITSCIVKQTEGFRNVNQSLNPHNLEPLVCTQGRSCPNDSYRQQWKDLQTGEKEATYRMAMDITESEKHCIDYENLNQCMAVCTVSDGCRGFYVDSPTNGTNGTNGTCCMIFEPTLDTKRHSYLMKPNDDYQNANHIINNTILTADRNGENIVFDRVGSDGFNDRYVANLDTPSCQSICPKCILGKCPDNYRCTNLAIDPNRTKSCVITNEDRYDEISGNTFDTDDVLHLDEKYTVNIYAGFDENNPPLISNYPSGKIILDN